MVVIMWLGAALVVCLFLWSLALWRMVWRMVWRVEKKVERLFVEASLLREVLEIEQNGKEELLSDKPSQGEERAVRLRRFFTGKEE